MRKDGSLVKRAFAAVAVSAAATAAIASFATSANGAGRAQPTLHADTAHVTSPATSARPPVQIHAVPVSAATSEEVAATRVVEQQVSLAIVGGDMTIAPSAESLTLTRVDETDGYTADLPTIRVVDARGTLAGWNASLRATDVPASATFTLKPGHARAVYGNQSEVQTARPSRATEGDADLMFAAPGGGGGTFDVNGTVIVTLPHAHASQITLHVVLTVT